LQALLVARPNYASWDDHDFGPNDSDMSFRLKNASYELFKKYWCNPTYGNGKDGVYTSFQWGDCEFFLLDDRTFRASDAMKENNGDTPNPDKTYWGKEQLIWLKNSLLTSRATFKFVVNGGQIGNPMDKRESVINFPAEYQELTNFLNNNKINGVIYLSGDRHFSEVLRYDRPNDKKAYPIYEITNSPMTSTPYSNMKEPELSNPLRVAGSLVNQENNYGTISVTGAKNNRQIVYQVKSLEGKKLYELTLNEKDLKWAKDKDKEEKTGE
jgi:alkaline phosphatase D